MGRTMLTKYPGRLRHQGLSLTYFQYNLLEGTDKQFSESRINIPTILDMSIESADHDKQLTFASELTLTHTLHWMLNLDTTSTTQSITQNSVLDLENTHLSRKSRKHALVPELHFVIPQSSRSHQNTAMSNYSVSENTRWQLGSHLIFRPIAFPAYVSGSSGGRYKSGGRYICWKTVILHKYFHK